MNLTEEQREEAERFFKLRRRIFDDANIKDNFDNCEEYELSWIGYDNIDFSRLNDQDKFALVVLIFDLKEYGVKASVFKDVFGWSKYKVYKIAKNEKFIYSAPLFREYDGLLAGKGYLIDGIITLEAERLYDEFLWHDISEPMPERVKQFLFEVDIPDVYTGQLNGSIDSKTGEIEVYRPRYVRYTDIPNWPRENVGRCDFPKSAIKVDKSCVKRWKINYWI